MKPSRGCSVITRHACTQPWAMSAPSSLNSSGIERRKQSQADQAATTNTGYGKAGKQSALSNFPTATTTTNYNQYGIRILRARSLWQSPRDQTFHQFLDGLVVKTLTREWFEQQLHLPVKNQNVILRWRAAMLELLRRPGDASDEISTGHTLTGPTKAYLC